MTSSSASPVPAPIPNHLILITCHATYIGPSTSLSAAPGSDRSAACLSGEAEDEWLLQAFQRGEQRTFVEHLRVGVGALEADGEGRAVLVISGGVTRAEGDCGDCGVGVEGDGKQRSEARGYLEVARARGWVGELGGGDGSGSGNGDREVVGGLHVDEGKVILEEKALDSYGNLLLGMISFWRKTGAWPEKITIISHAFKSARFMDLHVKALRIGIGMGGGEVDDGKRKGEGVKVHFVGKDPEYMDASSSEYDETRTKQTRTGEMEKGYKEWEGDLWGVGKVLRGKREGRDWLVGADGWRLEGGREGRVRVRSLFESAEERARSAVKTRWLEYEGRDGRQVREEVIMEGVVQPWEGAWR